MRFTEKICYAQDYTGPIGGIYIQGERATGQDENHQNKNPAIIGNTQIKYNNMAPALDAEANTVVGKNFLLMYTNVDSISNKLQELKTLLLNTTCKP